jgi:hypothetical protein
MVVQSFLFEIKGHFSLIISNGFF